MVSQTKSRKIPTRKILPLFFASRSMMATDFQKQLEEMKEEGQKKEQ